MIYTALTVKAMEIAYEAHKGAKDKNNVPYIYHPIHVAEQMKDEATTCVALLHDVVEDTDVTLEQLAAVFPKEIVDAVDAMTHREDVTYQDYLQKVKENPIATKVKLADIAHNMDSTRNVDKSLISQEKIQRWHEKYTKAQAFLTAGDTFIIGIAGGTGSGKSTFTKRLKKAFGDKIAVLSYDNYYRKRDDISFEERQKINYDHPNALETDLLIDHLKQLKAGKSVECPLYDFAKHNRSSKTITVEPRKVILVEGIMVLQNEELRDLLDMKIFVEADADERIMRRAIRDVKERGRDIENVFEQYLSTVKPMHYRYVEPTKYTADLILNSGMNDVAFDLLRTKIEMML